MGKHLDKAQAAHANSAPFYNWANLVITTACLFDYFIQGRPWALETLAALVVLLNGGGILVRWRELKEASKRDMEDMLEDARSDGARKARLQSRGLT